MFRTCSGESILLSGARVNCNRPVVQPGGEKWVAGLRAAGWDAGQQLLDGLTGAVDWAIGGSE